MKDFRSLKAWGKAHALTLMIYKSIAQFPKHELYSLTNQIQRAAVSVPANIAEGCGKDSDAELKRYFQSQWVPRASWNTCSCWHMNLVIFRWTIIKRYKTIWSKLEKCLTRSYRH